MPFHVPCHSLLRGCLPTEVFRVYEATDPFHAQPFHLSVSLAREACLLGDIESGRRLMRLGPVVLETRERALAQRMSQAHYL